MDKYILLARRIEDGIYPDEEEEDRSYLVYQFKAASLALATGKAKKIWEELGGGEEDDSVLIEMTLCRIAEEKGLCFEDPVKAQLRELQAKIQNLEDKNRELKQEIRGRDESNGGLIGMVRELTGKDPVELAKKTHGDIPAIAKNLLFEAVRVKAEEMAKSKNG